MIFIFVLLNTFQLYYWASNTHNDKIFGMTDNSIYPISWRKDDHVVERTLFVSCKTLYTNFIVVSTQEL